MYKIKIITSFLFILVLLWLNNLALASDLSTNINTIINKNPLNNTAAISISIREAKTSKLVYQRQSEYLLHTASTLKAFSTQVALKYLGADYKISTDLFKDNNSQNLYLKLSADPMLTSSDLVSLFKQAKDKGINSISGDIIIDDSIIDTIPWGVGWMWDDENNNLMPKYSAYNIDHNVIKVTITPQKQGTAPSINLSPYYPVKIVNTAITGSQHKLIVERKPWENPETIFVSGTVLNSDSKIIPIGNMKNYFISRLKYALDSNGIKLTGNIKTGKIPQGINKITDINRKLLDEITYTNRKSDNLAAETLLKLTGAKVYGSPGTTENGLKVFKTFYNSIGAPCDSQLIVDASGSSHNNLLQTNWMSLALSKLYNQANSEVFLNTLAQPSISGTMQNRLTPMKGYLWAKTGTLAGVSGIVGIIKSKNGTIYSFAILIQNVKGNLAPAKALENSILQTLFNY